MDASMASNQFFVVTLLIRMWNVDQSYDFYIGLDALQNCGTNRITHEVFAECGKIREMRDNHAKCVTGGNPRCQQIHQ